MLHMSSMAVHVYVLRSDFSTPIGNGQAGNTALQRLIAKLQFSISYNRATNTFPIGMSRYDVLPTVSVTVAGKRLINAHSDCIVCYLDLHPTFPDPRSHN